MRYTVYTNTNKQFLKAQLITDNLNEAIGYASTLKGFNDVWVNDNYTGKKYAANERVL